MCVFAFHVCILHITVFSTGDVVLKDLKLKAEALNSLKLPVRVKAGFVGSITLKVLMIRFYCMSIGC